MSIRLQGFLARNADPHQLLDPAEDRDAALVERYAPTPRELPLVVCPDGSILRNPSEVELARCIGMVRGDTTDGPTTWRSSAPARPGLRPRSTPPPKGSR